MPVTVTLGPVPDYVPPSVLSEVDVLRAYDLLIEDVFTVPLQVEGLYTRAELQALPVLDLQAVAKARGVFSQTTNREQIVSAVLNSQRVPVVWAQRETPWGLQQFTAGVEPSDDPAVQPDPATVNPVYPCWSIWRLPYRRDTTRYQGALRRRVARTPDGHRIFQALQPIPLDLVYQVDFAALDQATANRLDLFVMRLFGGGPPLRRLVDLGRPWGQIPVYLEETGMQDLSQITLSPEEEQKVVRHSFTVEVEAWVPQAGVMTPTVLGVRTDVVVQTAGEPDQKVLELDETFPLPE